MKYLGINKSTAYFVNKENQQVNIDQIGKDDILYLLESATNADIEFEMDDYNENVIGNQAHKIIYEHLYKKFEEILSNKTRFTDECSSLYEDARKKYNV